MKRILPAALLLAALGCSPSDGSKVVVNETLEVAPRSFGYHKFEVDYAGTYTMTMTAKNGDVESWVNPGASEPRFEFTEDGRLPLAKVFAAGKEDTMSGPLGWGGAYVVLYNRGATPVKVRCKVTYLENKPK